MSVNFLGSIFAKWVNKIFCKLLFFFGLFPYFDGNAFSLAFNFLFSSNCDKKNLLSLLELEEFDEYWHFFAAMAWICRYLLINNLSTLAWVEFILTFILVWRTLQFLASLNSSNFPKYYSLFILGFLSSINKPYRI